MPHKVSLTGWPSSQEKTEEKKDRYLRRERRYGAFSRSMPLPPGVNPEEIGAEYRDGILELSVPLPAEREPKRVEIKPRAPE